MGSRWFENWNRYYDPFSGRYLQPEPFLEAPLFLFERAVESGSAPTYGYAYNNPLYYVDEDGLRGFPAPPTTLPTPQTGPRVGPQIGPRPPPTFEIPWYPQPQATHTPWTPRVVRTPRPTTEFPFRPGPGKCFEDKEKCIEACWDARIHNTKLCGPLKAKNFGKWMYCMDAAAGMYDSCVEGCDK